MEDELRGWGDFPSEILYCIVSRVSGLKDRIQFGAVCKNWRYSFKLLPPSSWAWMFCTSPIPHHDWTMKHASFSLPDSAFISLPLILSGTRICGSFNGFLIATNYCLEGSSLFLLQPFSGADSHLEWNPRKLGYIRKAIIARESREFVMAALNDSARLFIATPRSLHYIPLSILHPLQDIIFYQGMLYAVDYSGNLFSIEFRDIRATTRLISILNIPRLYHDNESFHLVESRGKLLMVARLCQKGSWKCSIVTFKLFELQSNPPDIHLWVEVKSLEGDALFIYTKE